MPRPGLLALVTAVLSAAVMAAPAQAGAQVPTTVGSARLVASFGHQVTGVTVSATGRVFVNFPRWTEDAPVSVAEVLPDGSTRPYPDARWNAWRNTKRFALSPRTHFVSVQSVVVGPGDDLFVLDPAAPAQAQIVPRGPKLVRIDLRTNRVVDTIAFGPRVAHQGSYLNDIRFSRDGRRAYITDSGTTGAIVVVDLRTGAARRVLDGDPSTQVDPDVVVQTDGRPLRRPDGRDVQFAADGIALSRDGRTLFWQAVKGDTLYAAPTAALADPRLTSRQLSRRVRRIGRNGVADGLLVSRGGDLLVTSPEDNAVKARPRAGTGLRGGSHLDVLVQSPLLRWPDTLAQGPDGTLYVTTSHIQDSAFFVPTAPAALPTQLWAIGRT
jgi:sugar lactone lactonase YvrE